MRVRAGRGGGGARAQVLTTQNRDVWASLRDELKKDNAAALETVDSALFAVALDEDTPDSVEGLTRQFLLSDGRNRWFDKSYVEMLAKTVTVACCVGAGSVPAW